MAIGRRLLARNGISLPEVLVASLLLVGGVLCSISTLLSGRVASTGAKHWTQAMNVARARIERLKSLNYAELSSMPELSTETGIRLDDDGHGNAIRCTRTTSLDRQDGGIAITVLVVWNEKARGLGLVPWTYDLWTWVSFPGVPGAGGG